MTKTNLIAGHRYYFSLGVTAIYRFRGGDSGLYYFTDFIGQHNFEPCCGNYYSFSEDITIGEVPERKIKVELEINWN